MPLAAYAVLQDGKIRLRARLGSAEGRLIDAESTAFVGDSVRLGQQVAEQLLKMGGDKIIAGLD